MSEEIRDSVRLDMSAKTGQVPPVVHSRIGLTTVAVSRIRTSTCFIT